MAVYGFTCYYQFLRKITELLVSVSNIVTVTDLYLENNKSETVGYKKLALVPCDIYQGVIRYLILSVDKIEIVQLHILKLK